MPIVDSVFFVLAFGLAFALVGLGIFLSNRIYKLVDLTCESSFALGGCVYGSMVLAGMNPLMAIFTEARTRAVFWQIWTVRFLVSSIRMKVSAIRRI